jgi:hypothetical protein
MYRSSVQTIGGSDREDPSYIYYNADIVNNTLDNVLGEQAIIDPQIRFNETRDTAIVKNAADYYFSIVRFTMDGANKDLPLFIPAIKDGTGQTNVDLTVYSEAVSVQQTLTDATGSFTVYGVPESRYIQYVPETQNVTAAPTPRLMSANSFVGQWSPTTQYSIGQYVSTTPATIYDSYDGPFYQVITPSSWSSSQSYAPGESVLFNTQMWISVNAQVNIVPGSVPGQWSVGPPIGVSPVASPYWVLASGKDGGSQDLSTRYYWVYTYQHWVDLWNTTMFDPNPALLTLTPGAVSTSCWQDTYNAFAAAWAAEPRTTGVAFPYATYGDFVVQYIAPQMVFDNTTYKFRIYADSDNFGQRVTNFTPTPYAGAGTLGTPSPLVSRLFFNANMFGLYSNFNNTYWNDLGFITPSAFPGLSRVQYPRGVPDGYVNEILFTNKFYTNVADYRLPPYAGANGLGYVPVNAQRVYWIAEQDYSSVDSLWSPISSIVFTSTLLPVKSEATGAPVVLGNGNLGFSSPTVQSAFQPIITDISLDQSVPEGAATYRKFIYYVPSAEYRYSDFSSSNQEIRNIDVQVYWKNRLDNNLYPINMFNLSSVSLKMLFRHKNAESKSVNTMLRM